MTRIALICGATGGIVAACYNEVPGPSGPLPPTREVPRQGPKPERIMPTPMATADAGPLKIPSPTPEPTTSRVIEMNTQIAPQTERMQVVNDGGVIDVIDLPAVPDARGLDAPQIPKTR